MLSTTNSSIQVFLNRFCLKKLSKDETYVYVYDCQFDSSPEQGQEFKEIYSIIRNIGIVGVPFQGQIITKEPIPSEQFSGNGWTLNFNKNQYLELSQDSEKKILEKLERAWFETQLRQKSGRRQVERFHYGGFIWWDKEQIILKNNGWEVHTGFQLDIELNQSGHLFLEIDSHYRFHCPWTLSQWFQEYPEITPSYVRNTYDSATWLYLERSDELPDLVRVPNLGMSLAEYHRNHPKIKATEEEIKDSQIIYVKRDKKSQKTAHLSARVSPILDLNILSILSEQGQQEATKVFKEIR